LQIIQKKLKIYYLWKFCSHDKSLFQATMDNVQIALLVAQMQKADAEKKLAEVKLSLWAQVRLLPAEQQMAKAIELGLITVPAVEVTETVSRAAAEAANARAAPTVVELSAAELSAVQAAVADGCHPILATHMMLGAWGDS